MLHLPQKFATTEITSGPMVGFPDLAPYNCPVLALLVEYEKTIKLFNEEDASPKSRKYMLKKHSSRIDAIAEEASHLSSKSAHGATFQIMLAFSQSEYVINGSTPKIQEDAANRVERLLYRALERFGDVPDDFPKTRAFLMPAYSEPAK